MFDNVRVGVAGWIYPDWKGFVYPRKTPRNFHPLPFLAETFDIVEVDSSFYRIPDPITAGEWARKVSDFPKFRFSVKLFQGFTHTRKASLIEERAFHRALEPLVKFEKFSSLLVQLPWSFRNIPENRKALAEVLARFAEYPKAVELRHSSWVKIDILSFLREHRATFCNIDQPVFAHSTGPTAAASGELSYFRFHGRNAASWFKEGVGRDERYNYLYSPEEMASWVETVRDTAVVANEVAVVFNNHYKGQAAVNALEFAHSVREKKVSVMEDLIPHYPRLEAITSRPVQKTLFAGVSYNG